MLQVHARGDCVVSVRQMQRMDEALTRAGVVHQLLLVDGAQHACQLHDAGMAATLSFLVRELGEPRAL